MKKKYREYTELSKCWALKMLMWKWKGEHLPNLIRMLILQYQRWALSHRRSGSSGCSTPEAVLVFSALSSQPGRAGRPRDPPGMSVNPGNQWSPILAAPKQDLELQRHKLCWPCWESCLGPCSGEKAGLCGPFSSGRAVRPG